MVVEEWVCRDELAIVLQLGLDPVETAKTLNAREADSAERTAAANRGRCRARDWPVSAAETS